MEEKSKKIVSKDEDNNDIVENTLVVKELPMEPVRQIEEGGVVYNLITIEEALTELLKK